MSARIKILLQGVSMGNSHDGLAKIARKELGKDYDTLSPDDLILFMNNRGDKMKIMGGHGLVIGYLRMPNHQRIMKEALQYIPKTFGARGFDYDEACKKALDQRFAHYGPRRSTH